LLALLLISGCASSLTIPDTPAYRALARAVVHVGYCGTGWVVNEHQVVISRHILGCINWFHARYPRLRFSDENDAHSLGITKAPGQFVDLAVMELDTPQPGRALTLGDPSSLAIGTTVYSLGNRHGYSFIPHRFRVMARPARVPGGLDGVIVLEGRSWYGESGSPLVTEDGKVVGVLFATTTDRTFAIPVDPYLTDFLGHVACTEPQHAPR
jgi:hypothetical protein